MKFYGTTACLSFAGLLATAAIAAAQATVTTPPPGTVGPTNVQAGPVNVQAVPGGGTSINVAPGAGAAAANQIRNNAEVRQENRIERREERQMDRNGVVNNNWRMLNHNNQWWYWNPNNTWSVYRGNQWVPYTAGGAGTFVPNTGMNQPATQYYYSRRGPLGLRRQVTGYRGPITTTAPANPGTAVTPAPLPANIPPANAPPATAPGTAPVKPATETK